MSLDDSTRDDANDPIDQEAYTEDASAEEDEVEERPLNRQERRHLERQQKKNEKRQDKTYGELIDGTPITRPRQIDQQRDRRPRSSITSKPISRYEQIDNPPTQLTPAGTGDMFVKSRAEQVLESGALAGRNRKIVADEFAKIQKEINDFILWQAQREDYVIYQYAGYNEKEEKDEWVPVHYKFTPLTMGQNLRIKNMIAKHADLVRARDNNDRSVKDVSLQIDKAEVELWKVKMELYFRMYVGKWYHKETNEEVEPGDPEGILESDDEFERSAGKDVELAVQAYEWASLNLSSWKRRRRYAESSSESQSERTRSRHYIER